MATTRKGITVAWERFTPAEAQAILEDNGKHNRKLSEIRVRRLANSWDNGEFMDTADTIKFDSKGRLIDGQHRLAAVVLQGKLRWFLVSRGLKPDAIRVVDQEARPRTWGDAFHIEGHSNARLLAALVRSCSQLEKHKTPIKKHFAPTFQEAVEFLERRPGIEEITLPFVMQFKNVAGNVFSLKELGTLYEVIRVATPHNGRMFVEDLATGQSVLRSPGYVAYHQVRKAKGDPRSQPTLLWVLSVITLAWNDTVVGTVNRVKGYVPKPGTENYPLPKGFEKWLAEGGVDLK